MVIDKDNIKILLIILIVGLGLGYAYINSDLNINGTAQINSANWDVHWANLQVLNGSVDAPTPTITNQTTVNCSVTLTNPGDYYVLAVDAVNAGTIDAMIDSINVKINGEPVVDYDSLPPYLDIGLSYIDGIEIVPNQMLLHNTIETFWFNISYFSEIDPSELPSTDQTFSIQFEMVYKQADETAIPPRNYLYGFDTYEQDLNNSVSTIGQYFLVIDREISYFDTLEECNYIRTEVYPNEFGHPLNAQCRKDTVKKIGIYRTAVTSLENMLADVEDNIVFLRYSETYDYAYKVDVGIKYGNNTYFLYSGGTTYDNTTGAPNADSVFYEQNKTTLNEIAGQSHCHETVYEDNSNGYNCAINNGSLAVRNNGEVSASIEDINCNTLGPVSSSECIPAPHGT